jgi:glycosyltransferase involved in cell wall biosynthesis
MLAAMDNLFVSYSSALGGAERLLLDLTPALGDSVALACPPGPLADAAERQGLEVHPLRPRRLELRGSARDRLGAPLRIAAQGFELRRLVRAVGPRLLVAWNMRALLSCRLALAGRRRKPVLAFQHNDFLPGPLIAAAVRRAARGAEAVVCLSRAVAEDLDPEGRLIPPAEVVHPGVDLERFRPAPPPGDGPRVLVLGALVEWKRPDLALEAAAIAAARLPGLSLTFVGEPLGEDTGVLDRLRARAERPDLSGRVRFAGGVADPGPALAAASCLLHCADREPFGMALVEALASGRPVVVPAAGGPVEIVDGDCGRLYPPGDAVAAAEGLVEVLADPGTAARLGEGARRQAEGHFDLERARESFRAVLASAGGG